jgi:NodT family efflux transporter outer membrane factor (OMF) lipoprotein
MNTSYTSKLRPAASLVLLLGGSLALGGCTVGLDFLRPAPPKVEGYTARPQPAQTAATPEQALGQAQALMPAQTIKADWWTEFGSAKLDALIDTALRASPTLDAAQAKLRQAEQTYAAQAGSTLYPQVNADLGAQRTRTADGNFGQPVKGRTYNLYNVGVAVTYDLDLFGGNRRALESLAAQADYQRYQLIGTRLTLAANIVTDAMTQAQLAAQIEATEAILAAQQKQVDIAHKRFELGAIARGDEYTLRTEYEQTRASIPPLRNKLDQTNHLLATLSGQAPGAAQIPQFTLADFSLPTALPLIVPSELVRQRPDIQASEALLHSATADYGVAVADAYPKINLTGNLGTQALAASSLFGPGSLTWGLIGQVMQPLFNGGLKAGVNAAQASIDAALANYRDTVLNALRNVADVMRALDNDAETLQAQSAADAAAQAAQKIVQQQYQLGGASYLQLLVAQQQAQQTRINLIAAQAQRLTTTAAFYQAMGGGQPTIDETRRGGQPTIEDTQRGSEPVAQK